MNPINIYAFTRNLDSYNMSRLDKQMSRRGYYLKIKDWETKGILGLIGHLEKLMPVYNLEFFYSFQIPKLGKEFDLLRISDDTVINVELKSEMIPEAAILKQLNQNRYYLSSLGKNMRSYTYISGCDTLYRLTNSGKLIISDFEELVSDLNDQRNLYRGNIEELFKEENYIISPLNEPLKFLRQEYFLTSQQKDIEKKILKNIEFGKYSIQGFTGLPGTGKTLLLYDIAMKLSEDRKVLIVHCGSMNEELAKLNERLKRIDFVVEKDSESADFIEYSALLVDEGHNMSSKMYEILVSSAKENGLPVVICYDCEDAIAREEMTGSSVYIFEAEEGFEKYRLTNRIRANSELSSFIQCVMQGSRYNHRKEYPNVSVSFAGDDEETIELVKFYNSLGYTFIVDTDRYNVNSGIGPIVPECITDAANKEYNKVVMVMDEDFYYDEICFELRSRISSSSMSSGESRVKNLFHGLNRAKNGLAIIARNNLQVYDALLTIVQGHN